MNFEEADLVEIIAATWTSLLALDVIPSAEGSGPLGLRGRVSIGGAWHGEVVFECSRALSRILGDVMVRSGSPDTLAEDARDAVGELTNIVAGNVKALVPGHCTLSLPEVEESATPLALERVFAALDFQCEGEPMRITLRETST
jgi:chemotaxis protein CheX